MIAAPPGSFAPLRRPVFAVLWAASVLGNTGTFMRDVASAWLVTDLSPSPAAERPEPLQHVVHEPEVDHLDQVAVEVFHEEEGVSPR